MTQYLDPLRRALDTARFNEIAFPVMQSERMISHDGQAHKSYRVPGADWEPTGLNEEQGVLTIPLFEGIEGYVGLFPDTWRLLVHEVALHPIGELSLPQRGPIQAFVKSLKETFSGETRNGVLLVMEWAEHRPVPIVPSDPAALPAILVNSAIEVAFLADTAMRLVDPGIGTVASRALLIGTYIEEQLTALLNNVASLGFVQATFSLMRARVLHNRGLLEFGLARSANALTALARVGHSLNRAEAGFLAGLRQSALAELGAQATILDIAALTYGDASFAALLLTHNTVTNPFALPPGTRLNIPPDLLRER